MAVVTEEYCKECGCIMRHTNHMCLTCAYKRKPKPKPKPVRLIKESEAVPIECPTIEDLIKRIETLEASISYLNGDIRNLNGDIRELRDDIRELRDDISYLKRYD